MLSWGEYLCKGIKPLNKSNNNLNNNLNNNKVIEFIENYFKEECNSKFSSKIAIGYLQVKLDTHPEKMTNVLNYLLSILNKSNKICHPLQIGCPNIIPNLQAKPFWDSNEFSWVQQFEESYDIILSEFQDMKQKGLLFQPYRSPRTGLADRISDEIGELATNSNGDWNVCYLYLHGMDNYFEKNRLNCPKTTELISNIPRHYHHAFFSAITSQTHIQPHYGPTNKKLRCQFPLIIPEENSCTLTVAGITRSLQQGKCLIFDDSFIHEASNTSSNHLIPRVILIFDIWHPDLSDEEVKFLSFLENAKMKSIRKYVESNEVNDEDNTFASIIIKAQSFEVNQAKVWGES